MHLPVFESTSVYESLSVHLIDWMDTGMDSDVCDNLETDEMYLMLQADMVNIKQQETALKTEIVEVTNKFKQLLQSCGLESEFPLNDNQPHSEPATPSFRRSAPATPSLTQVTQLSASSDEEFLLQQMMKGPLCSLLSSSSDSLYGDSAMTLIIDNNSNYKPLPPPPDNSVVTVPNIDHPESTHLSSPSSSDLSNDSSPVSSNASSGYPKSSETSSDDNQCVPDCLDLQEELVSRMQYYSDFTIDRQRKINDMTVSLSNKEECKKDLTSAATEELFTREVEGCEDKDNIPPPIRVGPTIGASFPSTSQCTTVYSSTDCSTPSSKGTRRRPHRSLRNRTTSSQGSRKSSSNPVASSTMIEDYSPSSTCSSSSKKSSSIPQASSTMIEDADLPHSKPGSSAGSHDDLQSIYTWSINDELSPDRSLEESYFRNFNSHPRQHVKPPLPMKKVMPSSCSSSSNSSVYGTALKRSNQDQHQVFLGDSCAMPMDALSVIEPSTSHREAYLAESMYSEEGSRYHSLPRTSTRINLLRNNKSSGSSLEAKRASLPDIHSVCQTQDEDFHSVPSSRDSDSSSPLQERLELPGKSSSSNSSPNDKGEADMIADSILTDSPHSICSSGIFVPCNTPNVTDHSKSSHSTNSNKSDCQQAQAQIPAAPHASPASQKAKVTSKQKLHLPKSDGPFKIPRHTQPLRKLFKFKRSKGKTMQMALTSTPSHLACPSSVRSDPVSKRKLFSMGTSEGQSEGQVLDKKAVMRKFRRFSASFRLKDKSGLSRFQTLANL